MRKILLYTLTVIAVLIVVFVIVVALQPSEFHVARSATISAPASQIFPHINDLHAWEAWSPWAKLDPNAEYSFSGPDEGEGAVIHWSGNDEVGEGSMTIVESRPFELIRIRIDFVKPFEDTADVEFKFEPRDDQTLVTWSMSGENNFIAKAMCLFMDMDEMIGGMYEKGLANLKQVVEATPGDAANEG